jgi:hypothetical protein
MTKKSLQETARDIVLLLTGRSILDDGTKYDPSLGSSGGATSNVAVTNYPATQAVSAAALPLPANAATETGNLAAILAKLTADPATQATLAAVLAALNTGTTHVDLAGLQTTLNAILAEQRDDVFVETTLWEDRATVVSIFYRESRVRSQDDGTVTTIYTRLSDNVIVGSMPVGVIPVSGATDRTIEYYRWKAKNNGTGYTGGDWISNTLVFDTGGAGAVLSSTWYNLSTNAAIATAPLGADLQDPNDQLLAIVGAQADAAQVNPATPATLLSYIKGGLANWGTFFARIPASLGARPATGSFSVTTATDDGLIALIGSTTETAPATDTAASGTNGRLQRVAQNLTTLITKLSLGSQPLSAALATAIPKKLTIQGLQSTAAAQINLLDSTGLDSATDVTDYNSAWLYVTAASTGRNWQFNSAFDTGYGFAQPLPIVEVSTGNIVSGAVSTSTGTRIFHVNLSGVNFLQLTLSAGVTGVRSRIILSQAPYAPTAAPAATASTFSQLASVSALIADIASSTINTVGTTLSAVINPTWGVSQTFTYTVTATTGAPSLAVNVLESLNGVNYNVIANLTMTAAGTFSTNLVAIQGRFYQYQEIFSGAASSITRSVSRTQSNVFVPPYAGVAELGGINPGSAEFLVGARKIRQIYASNTTAIALFVQYHNKALALATGDIPTSSKIYSLPAVSGSNAGILFLSPSDFPPNGLNYGGSTRVAISSTRNTYTPAAMAGVNLNIEVTA